MNVNMRKDVPAAALLLSSLIAGTMILTSCSGGSGSSGSSGSRSACDACGPDNDYRPCPTGSSAVPPTPKPGQRARFRAHSKEIKISIKESKKSGGVDPQIDIWYLKAAGRCEVYLTDGTKRVDVSLDNGPYPIACYRYYRASARNLPDDWLGKNIELVFIDSDGAKVLPAEPPNVLRVVE